MATISDCVITPDGAIDNATIYAYKASRFSGMVPAFNSAPPGTADAGPVVTGPLFGGTGNFQIVVPTDEDYYCSAQLPQSGGVAWQGPYTAVDSAQIVHRGLPETIAGVKTFAANPILNAAAIPESAVANLTADLTSKAVDTQVVHLGGAETVTGAKTFGPNAQTVVAQTLSSNGSVAINAAAGNIQVITLAATATSSTMTGGLPGQVVSVVLIQDATGSRTFSWPTGFKFAGGTAPTLSTSGNFTDAFSFYSPDGVNWLELGRAVGVR